MAGLGLAHGRSNTRRSAPDNCACKPLTRKSIKSTLDTTGLLMEGTESNRRQPFRAAYRQGEMVQNQFK
jgi:hypothetical protein